MTFVLGMQCTDGIVICADRCEADGYSIRERSKIEAVNVGNEWGVCWAGSGTSDTVDRFSAMLRQALGNDSFNKDSIERKVDGCLNFIKKNYAGEYIKIVLGLFGRPLIKPKNGEPYLGQLERVLYRADSSSCCMSPEKEWCCAGLDSTLTKFLMASMFHRVMDVREAEDLGVFVTAVMKKFADGVRGPIDVAFYVPSFEAWASMTEENSASLEKRFPPVDAITYMSQYWAERQPKKWSDKKNRLAIQKLKRKLKPSTSRKSKGRR